MCLFRAISYTCTCTSNFRLSMCRGHWTYQDRRGQTQASCHGETLTLQSSQACGSCIRKMREEELDAEIGDLMEASYRKAEEEGISEWEHELPEEVVGLQTDKGEELYIMATMFPPPTKNLDYSRPEKWRGWRRSLIATSSLRREYVPRPDDGVDVEKKRVRSVGRWYDDWGEEATWMTLGDDGQWNEAARMADGLTGTTLDGDRRDELEGEEYSNFEYLDGRVNAE